MTRTITSRFRIGGWYYNAGYRCWEDHTVEELIKHRKFLAKNGRPWVNHIREIDEELRDRLTQHTVTEVTVEAEVSTGG